MFEIQNEPAYDNRALIVAIAALIFGVVLLVLGMYLYAGTGPAMIMGGVVILCILTFTALIA